MREVDRVALPVAGARTLVWAGGELYDVAAGWTRLPLDGVSPVHRYGGYGPQFDTAVMAPGGDHALLLAGTGTKGLVLDGSGRVVREIDRSYRYAHRYRYPAAFCPLPDGRTGLVHCPQAHDRLEIEDAVTGRRWTSATDRRPEGLFHSRLAVSASGRHLLSAGWWWHPWGTVRVYDLSRALSDPTVLDSRDDDAADLREQLGAEVGGACFVGGADGTDHEDVVVSTSDEPEEEPGPVALGPLSLARWCTAARRFVWRRQLDRAAGDLLPFAGGVLALHEHPRWFDAATGEPGPAWPDLATGRSDLAIVGEAFTGPARVAVDGPTGRFAVTDGERIVVVTLAG